MHVRLQNDMVKCSMVPEITVGIVFHNAELYIADVITSLQAQSFSNWEAVIVDDGSTDRSLEIVRAIADLRLRIFSDGLNKGVHVRRNEAVELARGRYFAIMDADDIMHPDRLRIQVEKLRQCSDNTVIGSEAYLIDIDGAVLGKQKVPKRQKTGYAARHSFINPTVAASTGWFRRNPWSTSDICRYAQDAELWCRVSGGSKFINLPQPLIFYRQTYSQRPLRYFWATCVMLSYICRAYKDRKFKLIFYVSRECVKTLLFLSLYELGCTGLLPYARRSKLSETDLQDIRKTMQRLSIPLRLQ